MSTRAMVDFVSSWDLAETKADFKKRGKQFEEPKPGDDDHYIDGKRIYRVGGRIYRHSDGYPDGLGADLMLFLKAVEEQTDDTRFDDDEYLAAKFVVWQALEYTLNEKDWRTGKPAPKNALDFLGIGVGLRYHGDLEYIYRVDCNQHDARGWPKIEVAEYRYDKGPKGDAAPVDEWVKKLSKFKPLPKDAIKAFEDAIKQGVNP